MYTQEPSSTPAWSNRKRAIPLRTYSGRIVYDTKPHAFTPKDLARISRKIELPANIPEGYSYNLMTWLREMTEKMMGIMLPFLTGANVQALYDLIFETLEYIFRIDTTTEYLQRSIRVFLQSVADRFGITITIK